jgi:tetratricopeptide (TPR) repeat protein
MASKRFGVNLVFALIAVALGTTALVAISVNLKRPEIRQAGTQLTGSGQLPKNHPSPEIANRLMTLEQLAAKDPQNPDYPTQIANLYYDLGQFDRAADFYQQSLKIRPQNPGVETDLATCYHYLGESDKALEILERVLKYSPDFPQALLNKGVVLLSAKNDAKGAISVWEALLRSDPDFPQRSELEQRIKQLRMSLK